MQSRPQLKSFLEYINGSVLNEEYLHQIPPPLISSWYGGRGAFCLQWHGGRGRIVPTGGGVCHPLVAASQQTANHPQYAKFAPASLLLSSLLPLSLVPSYPFCQFLSPSVGPFLIFTLSFFFCLSSQFLPLSLPPSLPPTSLFLLLFFSFVHSVLLYHLSLLLFLSSVPLFLIVFPFLTFFSVFCLYISYFIPSSISLSN